MAGDLFGTDFPETPIISHPQKPILSQFQISSKFAIGKVSQHKNFPFELFLWENLNYVSKVILILFIFMTCGFLRHTMCKCLRGVGLFCWIF
jgi:hypothetical protein